MLSGFIQLSPFDVLQSYSAATVQDTPSTIGGLGITTDGRQFRLGYNATASTTLAACKNTQGPVEVSSYNLGTVSAQAIGDTSVVYTLAGGAASVAANIFAGGFLSIATGTGSPQTLQIKGNPATTSATTITLQLSDPFIIATSGSVTANLWANPYGGVIICPTTITGTITGVPQVAIPGSTYGWFLVKGLGTCLGEGTTAQGLSLVVSDTTAGALEIPDVTGDHVVAIADMAAADTLYTIVNMQLG